MVVLSALVLATLASTGLAGVRYGTPPPEIVIPTIAGARQLAAEKGKPVVIHFWATWCHVCLEELPRFARLQRRYGASVDLVTISNEPADVAASYLRLWNIDLPLIADIKGTIFKAYGVGPIPVTIILDRAGDVVFSQVGELTESDLDRAVAATLTPVP